MTVTISARSGSYLDEIEHGGLSAYLANADGTVIFLDPGVPNADFANHSQATASFTVPVLPQVEFIGAAPPLLVSSTANDQATGLSLRVRHAASDRLLASWSNAAFTLRNFDITASALGTHGVDVRWHTAGFDGTESCGYKEQTIAFEVNDSVFTDVKVTVTHSITLFSGDSVQTNDKPRLRGSVTIDFLTPGRITVDTPTGLTVGCVGSNFAIVDPAQSEKGFGLDGTGQSPRDLVITTGFTVPDDDSEVVLSLAFANAASPAAADKVTITYTFPIMTTVATSLPDDINYGHRSTLAFSGSTKLSVMEPGVAAARVYLQLPDDSKPDDNLRFKDTEPPLEAGRTFSLTLRSGGVTTAFTIDASVYNDRLLDIQDDRFGYDFANLRKHPSADEYYGEGLYLKAGATLAARKITLHIGSRSGAYISEFEHPALSAYLAANPAAELLNPGVKSVDGDIVNFQVTATSRVGPLILTVAPQLVMTGAPRRLDATTLTGAAPTGVSVRLDWDGTGLLSFSPGAEIGANNAVLLNPRAKGLPRLPGACGEDLVPVTVTVDDRETRAAIFRKQVEFTVTLYDPQAIGGSQVPAIASGPTARLEAGARLDAAVPTGFVFDCAGGGFAASFSNAAFELAGAAPRFEVVIKRGEAVAAGAAGLTTRITYSQGAGTPTYQTDLTVLVGGSIALSPPATLPTVPANQRPAITFTGASTPIDSNVAYAATARLHPGGATYRNMDSFLRQSFDLTVYDLSGSNRTKTTYFEIAAAQYNSRLVQFSDDRFGADARGLYILPGSRFDPAPLTLTLTLNSGSHLGRIGHPALNAFLATANASNIEALDPAVGNGFALTASSVVEVTLRVRPAVALGGTQAALDSTTQTTFVDTGLRLTASYAGAALERTVSPAVFAIGDAGSDGHAISINMGALADAAAQSRTLGCGLYAVEGAASFHPAGDAGAAAATAFSVTLRDAARIRLADRPSIVGFQSIALEAGTLAADFDTGLAFECAAPDFSATFSNPNLVHASTPVNGQLGITLRSGAVIGQGVNLLEVVASARQAASGPEHLFTLTLRVNQSIAIRPPTTLPPVDAADRPQLVTTAAPALIRPNQAYAATTYLYDANAAPQFRNMNRFQIAPFILTVRDRGSNAERTFTIAADSYNSLLVGLSDSRFGVDFTEVDSGSSQRIRGIYIRPGARFSSEPLTLSLTLGNGAYPIQLQHPELASYLASGSNLQALAPGAQGLTLALTASAVVEIPLRISPDAAAGGVQISIDATRTQGVLDTGLRLQASYGGAALNASASPDIFSLGTPSGGSYPVSMDMSRLAAAPQNYGSCGDFSVPGSAVFAVASDTSLVATVGFSITLYDPRKIRDTEEPEIGGAVTITLEQEAEVGTALPIGLVFDCAGPNFSMSSTPAVFSAVAGAHDAQRQVVLNPITLTADTSAVTAQVVYSQGSGATYTANFTVEVAGPLASIQIHANRLAREVARASSGNMLRSVNKRIDLGVGSGSSLDRAAAEELLRMIGNKERELEEGGANLRELLDGQDFSLGLGANGAAAPGASLWGQANVYSLDRAADDFSYDGALFSGLLGFDYRTNGALFGLVAGHHSGEFTQVEDDDPSVFENDMQTVAPYFAFELGNGGRILALAGAGAGEMAISNEKTEEEYGKVDTNLVFYSMGYSQDLGLENGRMLFKGDFTGNQLSVDGDPELAYDEAENSIWQLRAALEVARGINQGPVRVEPSIEIAARMDIYDDDLGPTERDLGYEAILGLEYDDGGRLFGRVDASLVKLGEHVDSFGLGIGLRFSPGAGQLGLGFDLEPRYGSLTTSGSLYDQDATLEELRTQMGGAAPGLSATSSLRYGIGLPGRVAAPYLTYRLQEENADYVLGIRIHQGGAERWTMSYAPDDDGLMQLRYRIGN
ncbi:MAG: hypothetical protein ISN26_07710 [Betaproteobacteria bacterium AqS2]|uniref:Autotransporter domain-containing protein n=1 Tax=Candidatus Amphirhobacter heronislandensis TaxID=1732024 RepID=A0A930UHP2_9GAMM|nr:hypothetical protein [Betaproteobacteria bacterium AqS2]